MHTITDLFFVVFCTLQMVSLLLVKGANVKAKDRKERTPLHLAAYMGMLSTYYRIVCMFSDINASLLDKFKFYVLHTHTVHVNVYIWFVCIHTGHSECISILVGNQSEVNAVDNQVCILVMNVSYVHTCEVFISSCNVCVYARPLPQMSMHDAV